MTSNIGGSTKGFFEIHGRYAGGVVKGIWMHDGRIVGHWEVNVVDGARVYRRVEANGTVLAREGEKLDYTFP